MLPLALFALAGVIGLTAIADHRWKQRRINRAELSAWYCRNEGVLCGGPSPFAMERHWNQRQVGYEIGVTLLGTAAALVAVRRLGRR